MTMNHPAAPEGLAAVTDGEKAGAAPDSPAVAAPPVAAGVRTHVLMDLEDIIGAIADFRFLSRELHEGSPRTGPAWRAANRLTAALVAARAIRPDNDDYVYLRDGSVLGRVTGWAGGVPIIDTTDRLPGPSPSDSPCTREAGTRSEAPAGDATPRTRGVEPATTPDLAQRAVGGPSTGTRDPGVMSAGVQPRT